VGFGKETSCLLSSKQDVTAFLAFSLACVLDEPQDTSPVSVCCVQLFEVLVEHIAKFRHEFIK